MLICAFNKAWMTPILASYGESGKWLPFFAPQTNMWYLFVGILLWWKSGLRITVSDTVERWITKVDGISYAMWLTHPVVLLVIRITRLDGNWITMIVMCIVAAAIVSKGNEIVLKYLRNGD